MALRGLNLKYLLLTLTLAVVFLSASLVLPNVASASVEHAAEGICNGSKCKAAVSTIYATALISIPDASSPNIVVNGNGATVVNWWVGSASAAKMVRNQDGSVTFQDTRKSGQSLTLQNCSALVFADGQTASVAPPQDGVCGSSNHANLLSSPTGNLCVTGSATLLSGDGPWNWSCRGTHGGKDTPCSAFLLVNGSCGASNKIARYTPPDMLCNTGDASAIKGTGPWTWTCNGSNGGSTSECSTGQIVDGLCGASDHTAFTDAPVTNLCSAGEASPVRGSGPWAWICEGVNGGTSSECAAQVTHVATVITGGCGSANKTNLASAPTNNLCTTGTASAVTGTGPWNWSCTGSNNSAIAQCSAALLSVAPKPVAEVTSPTPPQPTAAAQPSEKVVVNPPPPPNAAPPASTPPVTVVAQIPITEKEVPKPAAPLAVPSHTAPVTPQQISLALAPPIIPPVVAAPSVAKCGPANGGTYKNSPTSGLCAGGKVSTISENGSWKWSCVASDTKTSASCSASISTMVNGICGPASGAPASGPPVADLCSNGTPSAVTGEGPWNWACVGSNGSITSACATVGSCNGVLSSSSPVIPTPANVNDIVGVNIQNTMSAPVKTRMLTFGQIFVEGQVKTTDTLVARINGTAGQVQVDSLANWPDGSFKVASVTLSVPNICGASTLPVMLSKVSSHDPAFNTKPVDLIKIPLQNLSVEVDFLNAPYVGETTINIEAALKMALSQGEAVYDVQGPLATQAHVNIPVADAPMHIRADVTTYADGSVVANLQFHNDPAGHGKATPYYKAVVNLGLQTVTFTNTKDQDWRVSLNSSEEPDGTDTSAALPAFRIHHDLSYLEDTGALPSYDRHGGGPTARALFPDDVKLQQAWTRINPRMTSLDQSSASQR